MKKTYCKPEIVFDNFGISSNFAVAAGCTYSPDLSTSDSCGVTIAGRSVFINTVAGCKYKQFDGYFGICYYVPTSDSNVFLS